ncbi:MAG: xanthine dehydrogenase family protein [Clostridia bacterium]|nr:xanthine dehydrogenase family protein [Clostridia bacterium]
MTFPITTVTERRAVGRTVPRKEDPTLLTGRATFTGDLRLPGMLDLVLVRSPYAHAKVRGVRADAARKMPGVAAVATFEQIQEAAPSLMEQPWPALARGEARFVGEGVAAVVAEGRAKAEDAAEQVAVEYEPLPACLDLESAPVAQQGEMGFGDVERAFARADVVVRRTLRLHRASAHPLEPRAVVAAPDPETGGLVVWTATQGPHRVRETLAAALGLPVERVRVIVPRVGGGFGVKNGAYPEDLLAAWFALKLGRPVRFLEDRREHFVATVHEREQVHHAAIAARRDGTLLAVEDTCYVDYGAYPFRGFIVMGHTARNIPGPYRMEAYRNRFHGVLTNRTPTGPYRGAGRPQANFIMERMMDALARELGLPREEVRRRNLITAAEMPFERGLKGPDGRPIVYDSGDPLATFEAALEAIDLDAVRALKAEAARTGRLVGVGFAVAMEDTGRGPMESATAFVREDGRVAVATGAPDTGQSHGTTAAQVVADALGLDYADVVPADTDTSVLPDGVGTFGSRSGVMMTNAARRAAEALRDAAMREAAELLEVPVEELCWRDGAVEALDGRRLTLAELVRAAGAERLRATASYESADVPYGNGAQAVVAEVDPHTFQVRILRYVMAHDCGTVVNPAVVEGQIHGGIVHGLSGALFEELVYDEHGQLTTGTYMDYLIPTAAEMPRIELRHLETPSPLNPIGTKGAGESGTIPALAAIAAAVEDALASYGVEVLELPATPARLHTWVRARGVGDGR